jgi:hypothetical protein
MGRVGSCISMTVWMLQPIGALVGAALGQAYGARQALIVAVCGFALGCLFMILSPLSKTKRLVVESEPLPVGVMEEAVDSVP